MLKVLVVDDDEGIRLLLEYALAVEYTVITAGTIQSAKKILKEERIDLLMLDVYLDNEEGMSLVYWIHGENIPVKIIMITGDANFEKSLKEEGLRNLVDHVLVKPFDITDTIKVAAKVLEKKVEYTHGRNKA